MVDRAAFDRIVEAGGFITAPTGGAPDAQPDPDPQAGRRRGDGRGRVHRLRRVRGRVPERSGQPVHRGEGRPPQPAAAGPGGALSAGSRRWWRRWRTYFGSCTNHGECEAACPKWISHRLHRADEQGLPQGEVQEPQELSAASDPTIPPAASVRRTISARSGWSPPPSPASSVRSSTIGPARPAPRSAVCRRARSVGADVAREAPLVLAALPRATCGRQDGAFERHVQIADDVDVEAERVAGCDVRREAVGDDDHRPARLDDRSEGDLRRPLVVEHAPAHGGVRVGPTEQAEPAGGVVLQPSQRLDVVAQQRRLIALRRRPPRVERRVLARWHTLVEDVLLQ